MNRKEELQKTTNNVQALDELRDDVARRQKSGLPFIMASVIIWTLISIVCSLNIKLSGRNFLVFCCSCPLMPLAMLAAKILKVNIFGKENPLGKLGFLFTMNQMIYLLIVMWAFSASPQKMVMIYAMVFGAHLLPYSWLYKEKAYLISAILLPVGALVLEYFVSTQVMAIAFAVYEILFSLILYHNTKKTS